MVLSPGFTQPVSTLTSLAEDLASRGYVVAGIDHPYESHATPLADGRIAECLACDSESDPGFGAVVAEGRAGRRLLRARPAALGVGRRRPDRPVAVAMAGHSIGGASAIAAMLNDSRVRAGGEHGRHHLRPHPQGRVLPAVPVPRVGATGPRGARQLLEPRLAAAGRVEALARAVGRGAAVVHRPPAHGRGPRRRAVPRHPARGARRRAHPHVRGRLPRPAPEVPAAALAGQALIALPRGEVLPRGVRALLGPGDIAADIAGNRRGRPGPALPGGPGEARRGGG